MSLFNQKKRETVKEEEGQEGREGDTEIRDEKRRELDEEDRRCKEIPRDGRALRKASLLTVLKNQPWAASVMLACTYLCIYFPLCKIQNCLLQRNNKSIHV